MNILDTVKETKPASRFRFLTSKSRLGRDV